MEILIRSRVFPKARRFLDSLNWLSHQRVRQDKKCVGPSMNLLIWEAEIRPKLLSSWKQPVQWHWDYLGWDQAAHHNVVIKSAWIAWALLREEGCKDSNVSLKSFGFFPEKTPKKPHPKQDFWSVEKSFPSVFRGEKAHHQSQSSSTPEERHSCEFWM